MTSVDSKRGLELIERHIAAMNARDEHTFGDDYHEDAVVRMAGVPRSLGGVLEGRRQIVENFHRQAPSAFALQQMFGDDTHVCVTAKVTNTVPGTEFLRAGDQPFTTYECVIYRMERGRIREQTTYVNWLDAYVQAGLVDLGPLRA
jgi:ketosteroid isomerase-like protein